MSNIRVALAQLAGQDGLVERNLARVDDVVDRYGPTHDVVVFPETYVMGFPQRDVTRSLAEPLDGPIVQHLERRAKEVNTTIVVGLNERAGDHVYNTTVVVAPSGLLLSYRKTHLWVGEQEKVEAGDFFRVAQWRESRIGLMICYDMEFPEPTRILATAGAEVVFSTNANMAPYGPVHRVAAQARAQENQVFVVSVNCVGRSGDNHFIGESVIVDPYGNIVAQAGQDEEVVSATLDLTAIERSKTSYHYLRDQRVGCNTSGAIEVQPGLWEIQI
ncbi:carbon-nitrogen hydrolase family protein [Alicyclobacillus fastidiosus]|uniref:Carbon-nitrogen hydrolase family protein n=1 Tax=Alicyclobacillus fastidiosus TaxID=392011 RepID=A0ABV5AJP4_9BACL|nr:carbon-nitrogen hydrolase family protein [Alicyclobacillus fastidiosus]WEH08263.1 carbon-nitrogen hydrolase family protein [Alicyclobacillus fastidiosus]